VQRSILYQVVSRSIATLLGLSERCLSFVYSSCHILNSAVCQHWTSFHCELLEIVGKCIASAWCLIFCLSYGMIEKLSVLASTGPDMASVHIGLYCLRADTLVSIPLSSPKQKHTVDKDFHHTYPTKLIRIDAIFSL